MLQGECQCCCARFMLVLPRWSRNDVNLVYLQCWYATASILGPMLLYMRLVLSLHKDWLGLELWSPFVSPTSLGLSVICSSCLGSVPGESARSWKMQMAAGESQPVRLHSPPFAGAATMWGMWVGDITQEQASGPSSSNCEGWAGYSTMLGVGKNKEAKMNTQAILTGHF